MPRKSADAAKLRGALKPHTVTLDDTLLPFIMAMSPGKGTSVSAGVRATVRAAIFHMERAGRWPAAYLLHVLRTDRPRADAYISQWPDQAPEGYEPPAAAYFKDW